MYVHVCVCVCVCVSALVHIWYVIMTNIRWFSVYLCSEYTSMCVDYLRCVTQNSTQTQDVINCPLSFSDITIQLADRALPAHRFVLVARSAHWNPTDDKLKNTASLDLTHLTPFVASCLIRWVYTDNVVLPSDQAAVIEMLSAANQYRLPQLKEK